jgi:hypothetical protein
MSNDDPSPPLYPAPVQQEWVTIRCTTTNTDPEEDLDHDNKNDLIGELFDSEPQQQHPPREKPATDCHWNDNAILQAFRAAIASHDYDPTTATALVEADDDDDDAPLEEKEVSSSTLPLPNETPSNKKRNSVTTSTPSSWEPRPLPLPTWAIDIFQTENERKEPPARTKTVAATKSQL